MKYLDTNIFLLPMLYEGDKANKAKEILESMVEGNLQCATASLTLDEFAWVIIKIKKNRKIAIEACKDILELPNLKILAVSNTDVILALEYMEKYEQLKPRDAIHLAVCINSGIFTIISDDSDFDNINEINREDLD